ncbi:MAG TPA: hypothetical protein VLB44_26125 [Kofleriaceae bacterium]|nr:hypothetical protein [Kofleriaceae bacterium]
MKRFFQLMVMAGVPFGAAIGIVSGLKHGLASGLGSGIACGVMFGLAIATFVHVQSKKFGRLRPLYEKEGLIIDGGANLGGKGGWLFLTKQRLVFEPHGVGGGSRVEIPLGTISEVRPASGLLVRRFEVVAAGKPLSFLVENRDRWLEAFAPLLGLARATSPQ